MLLRTKLIPLKFRCFSSSASSTPLLTADDVYTAAARLSKTQLLYRTPTFQSPALNSLLGGHRVYFKCENLQRVGAFKSRGALNAVLHKIERGETPKHVVAYSSGNHAQAVSWACAKMNVPCTIYMPSNVSPLKAQATAAYGAEVVLTPTRPIAEQMSAEAVEKGALLIPPFDDDCVITGQGTACLEAVQDLKAEGVEADCVIAPVGGGGLISGTFLASHTATTRPVVIGAEPLLGNDASLSFQTGAIHTLPGQPLTMADGAMTMAVSPRTFEYVKQLNDIYEISELEIQYWTQWMTHLLKLTVEPTGSLPLGAAVRWLGQQQGGDKKTVLCIISGGNLALNLRQRVWSQDHLTTLPSLSVDWNAMQPV